MLVAKGVSPGHLKALTSDLYEDVAEVLICEHFGWTLNEVRSLDTDEYLKVRAIVSGLNQVRNG